MTLTEFAYPRAVGPHRRVATGPATALLARCSNSGWTRDSWLDVAGQADRYGDAIGALFAIREAKRAAR
jgi:hypothetical protein